MNYELAKQLKDAGFPQPRGDHDGDKIRGHWYTTAHQVVLGVFDINDPNPVYIPTLSELIEACGDTVHFSLDKLKDGWAASDHYKVGEGKTPEEAVAHLWLALNSKKV